MSQIPPWAEQIFRDMHADSTARDHHAEMMKAVWWQRWGHILLVSWRCPACKWYRAQEKSQ